MPNGTVCQLVKLPIVIADIVDSITVENTTCLEEQAKKVDHVDVRIEDLEADPVFSGPVTHGNNNNNNNNNNYRGRKNYYNYDNHDYNVPKATVHFGEPVTGPREIKSINISGTVHKQIYFVDRDDDVRHMSEDIDFTKSIKLDPPLLIDNPRNIDIDFKDVDVDIDFELPRPTRINQVVTISFTLKIVEQTQMYVNIYPNGCEPSATLGIQEESFEEWIGNIPANWEGENIGPNPNGRTGQAAQLGVNPALPATLTRTVTDVLAGATYQLSFWARSIDLSCDPCDFTLTAQINYLDAAGNLLNTAQQTITANQLSDTYRQFTVSGTAPEGTASAMIGFVFTPGPCNTCSALIDDLSFGQVGA